MIIGIPKEIKNHEYRVGATPSGVYELVAAGHQVLIETHAGSSIGFENEQYISAGAKIVNTAQDVYSQSDMILKVKEPQAVECDMIREGQIVFSYLHLAAEPELTNRLLENKCIGVAFETVTDNRNSLPLLAPMSEVAGKLSVQAGARALEKSQQGRGVLLGGVPGVEPGNVVIIGGGVSGTNAAKVAIGMGANVTILDKNLDRVRYLSDIFQNSANVIYSTKGTIEQFVKEADLVIGAVLIPGASAPKLVSEQLIKEMKKGAVIVDIAIDQGGCFETSKPTSHSQPTYIKDEVVHYCVTNMPGAVARTSTLALENATLPYTLQLANKGYAKAFDDNQHLLNGLNVIHGKLVYKAVADSLNLEFTEYKSNLA